jgi:penicillin-binding protein 1B
MTRSRKKSRGSRRGAALHRVVWRATALAIVGVLLYAGFLAWRAGNEFEGRRWDVPAQVFAAPLELYAGRALSADDLVGELKRLGYREDPRLPGAGSYRLGLGRMEIATRGFDYAGDVEPPRAVSLSFGNGRIGALRDTRGGELGVVRLDPLPIGSLFPAHGEDRLIIAPGDIPPLLPGALKAVEDRRFDQHHGIDVVAVARATLVNLSAGEIRQGASTLTQQLVRSYFLSNERSWTRKLREAFMAISLELRYDKDELMAAYVNEIYLGQDGARAVHGFGLASQFYFGKPLAELELHELALLVAVVRGPTYYDPRRHADRALERRNLVLNAMADARLVSPDDAAAAAQKKIDLLETTRRSATQSAFLGLVRRQLAADYADDDLERTGLKVQSTLDPAVQAAAERALTDGIAALGERAVEFDGALIVTSPHTGEVSAVVGGRRTGFEGFNRALDARRQIGSLIKPAVYLAALESGRYNLATVVDDSPIEVKLENGDTWTPRNFDNEAHGPVPVVRALAESLNMATVRVGLDVGLEPISRVLQQLGLAERPPLYPSMLLGALALTPIEVAQIYNTLANGGFRVPLRSVRSVIGDDGAVLQRYSIEIEQAADPAAVYALNQALVQVMERGTGRTVRGRLPAELTVAGKTGTSDDLRDSWFAGFTNDHLIVAWLGADDNRPIGLTGSSGAARIWAGMIGALEADSYEAARPESLEYAWVDYLTGEPSAARCPEAVRLPLPETTRLGGGWGRVFGSGCAGSGAGTFGARVRRWLRDDAE